MSSFCPNFSNFVLICPFFLWQKCPVCPFLLLKIVLFSFEDNPKLEWEPCHYNKSSWFTSLVSKAGKQAKRYLIVSDLNHDTKEW